MNVMHRFAVLTILLAGIQPLAIDAYRAEAGGGHESKSALTLDVTPRYTFANGTVLGTARVAPDSGNRLLRVVIDSGSYLRSSDIELAGADAAPTYSFSWKALPSGEYVADAVVFGSTGERAHASAKFSVETLDAATGGRQWHGLWAALQR